MTRDDLVEVPENALIEERIAFGLTAPQLGIAAVAGLAAAALNLLPLWAVAKVLLILLVAGSLALAAVLSIRGEPAYRWLLRALGYWRAPKVWHASVLDVADRAASKRLVSGDMEDDATGLAVPAVTTISEAESSLVHIRADNDLAASALAASSAPAALPATESSVLEEQGAMDGKLIRLPIGEVDLSEFDSDDSASNGEQSPPLPYVLRLPRLVCLLSFAGGVGKTALAVELASYLAATARYRSADNQEHPVRVLVVDAARLAPAAGLRLGLSARALSEAWRWVDRTDAAAVASTIRRVSDHLSLLTLPPDPSFLAAEPGAPPEARFEAREANAIVEAARRSGAVLIIADLGTRLEPGHVRLIELAELSVGVVRPTVESLPDLYRLSEWLRRLGTGHKLAYAANLCPDDREVASIAREVDVPLLAAIAPSAALAAGGERGEPAWPHDQVLADELGRLAGALWPMQRRSTRQPGLARLALGRLGAVLRRSG